MIFRIWTNRIVILLLTVSIGIAPAVTARSETPDEWITLGHRVHGGFGTYIALGIRIGLDAMQRLKANPRELDVTYQTGNAPCPCVADGIMLATVATPRQNTLRIASIRASDQFGVAIIRHRKTGQTLRYTIPIAGIKPIPVLDSMPS